MGQTLSEPVTEKHTSADEDSTLLYGVSEMQGWRISMEDAHATILKLQGDDEKSKISFFAVYDGHGGSAVAKYAGKTVHGRLANTPQFKSADYEGALKRAFLGTDEDLREDAAFANDSSGCTAVAALLVPGQTGDAARRIIVANAGDSRSVLSLKGEAKPMSYDHKPTNQKETARIVGAGGFVEFGRVNGNLALSRALGDFEFKGNHSLPPEEQAVTADPDIIVHDMTNEEEFLVLACDGIFDCLSNQQVVDFVRRGIANGKELKTICEEAMERCLAPDTDLGGIGSDNMTICIVGLLNGKTKEEWYAWIKERVENKVGWDTPEDIAPVFQQSAGGLGGVGGLRGALSGGRAGLGGAGAAQDAEDAGGLLGGMRFGQGGGGGGGSGGMFSAFGGFGGAEDGEDGGPHVINLPASLAGALSSAGIVLRPSRQPNEDGETVYEARYADEDDSEDEHAAEEAVTGSNDETGSRFAEVSGDDKKDESEEPATQTSASEQKSGKDSSAAPSASSASGKKGDEDDAMTGVETTA
ncbi:Protein phosphatase 2C 2 [Tilletia horrida]|uniref:protein-serine/threonine phosphatase n=1 Tax=Tilletia horrida TaxID=155126 RepID=A0AAN6GUE0_9BASI|nr:Protein phosphatase 2C 2 [Tilletia horrida]KAK0569853.1 Protein phosphatase 2C 2 [Tilletia horrida]